jgi:nucleotide-binding universal stress UspA family protein
MLPQLKTILYATDLSAHSPRVFRYAMSLAQQYGGKIVIVHAMEPLSPFAKSMVDLYVSKEQNEKLHGEALEKMKDMIRERLELFCKDELCTDPAGRDRVTDILILEGRPPEVILEQAARLKPDLIVMGSHGHTAVGEILLGTTAHRVMQRAPVPVFLVRLAKE